jgi:hypothetical protein
MCKKKTILITLFLFLAGSMTSFADVIVYENDFEDPCQVDALSGWNWGDGGIAHNVAYVDYEGNTVVEHTGIIDASAAALTTRFGSKWGIALSGNTSADPNDYTIEFDLRSVSGDWDPIDLEFFVLTGGGNGVGYGSGASAYAQADGWVHVTANLADLTAGWWAGTAWDMTVPDWQIEVGGPPWPGITVPAGTPAWDQVWLMDNLKITMISEPVGPSTEGLVAYYALEGDALDSSGNGLDGTLEVIGSGNDATFVAGAVGMAIDLLPINNGTEGTYVNCGADPLFDFTDAVTVGAWVNFRSIPDEWRAIVTKADNAWRLSNNGATTAFQFSFSGYGVRPGNVFSADGTIEVGFDSWHYVCGTYDITEGAKLYVDGVLDVMTPDTVGIDVNTNDVWIGGNNGDTSWKPYRLFDGMIDEVRIYNRALSADEVAFLSSN